MAARADLVSTPNEERPYKIVFWRDGQMIGELPIGSLDAAVAIAEDLVGKLRAARDA